LRRHPLAQMLAIGLVASAAGVALALAIDWFPVAGSAQADDIDTLYDVLLICSVPVFVMVMTVVLYEVWRFRVRPGDELRDGPPIHGNTRLEVIWTAIPAIMMVSLCVYAFEVLRDVESADAKPRTVVVKGQQFAWSFEYPGAGGAKKVVSNELVLPVGQQVDFKIDAEDVLHSFWVPAMRLKMDAVPGIITKVRWTPIRRGSYEVVCAELCGIGHATMRQTARIVTQAQFAAWMRRQQAPAGGGGGGQGGGQPSAAAGKQVFTAQGCGACHTLADAGATGEVGPNLDQVLKGKDAGFIETSIVDPDAEIAKGYEPGIMPPDFKDKLSPEQLASLVLYLRTVSGK
jgi:cytochrome c oxidase subunit 2